MDLNIYWLALLVLAPLVAIAAGYGAVLSWWRRWSGEKRETKTPDDDDDDEARKFELTFLRVYLLVIGSEWLQGRVPAIFSAQNPFMYSLLRDEKTLDEATVATLYISTYVAAAVAALLAGHLADRFGRRGACLAFCAAHSLAAASVCFDGLAVLVAGRVLGGVALALLWTAFESWLIAEYNARGLTARGSVSLASLFGAMTTYKCITAIVAGVLGHCVVLALGSKIHPFLLGVALDLSAAVLMMYTWNENWGTTTKVNEADDKAVEAQTHLPSSDRPKTSLWDLRVWAMSFVACCFEGTIFLFMFFWPETLQHAHDSARPAQHGAIPHGVIFASFMAIMVLGAQLFNLVAACPNSTHQGPARRTLTPTHLLRGALVISAACFLAASLVRGEVALFASFLLLEVCNGVYVPSVAYHRGIIVTDDARARVYSLMNIPLFVFVVVALGTAHGGSEGRWQPVFLFCAVLLLIAALVASMCLHVGNGSPEGFLEVPTSSLDSAAAGVNAGSPTLFVEALGAELGPDVEDVEDVPEEDECTSEGG
ncbi:hypothetical protein F4802DRAFT_593881 [Xylaria palmicola]|nr:hypothetical protein F4802DRAFT_593881 [Xylaria palmicola]